MTLENNNDLIIERRESEVIVIETNETLKTNKTNRIKDREDSYRIKALKNHIRSKRSKSLRFDNDSKADKFKKNKISNNKIRRSITETSSNIEKRLNYVSILEEKDLDRSFSEFTEERKSTEGPEFLKQLKKLDKLVEKGDIEKVKNYAEKLMLNFVTEDKNDKSLYCLSNKKTLNISRKLRLDAAYELLQIQNSNNCQNYRDLFNPIEINVKQQVDDELVSQFLESKQYKRYESRKSLRTRLEELKKKELINWGPVDCADWLKSLKFEKTTEKQLVKIFLENKIYGDSLLILEEEDLIRMGINAIGVRKKLVVNIEELKLNHIEKINRNSVFNGTCTEQIDKLQYKIKEHDNKVGNESIKKKEKQYLTIKKIIGSIRKIF